MIGEHVTMESINEQLGERHDAGKIKFLLGLVQSLMAEIARLKIPPRGYPECTSAIVKAMARPEGEILIRAMHANEHRIADLYAMMIELAKAADDVAFQAESFDLSENGKAQVKRLRKAIDDADDLTEPMYDK